MGDVSGCGGLSELKTLFPSNKLAPLTCKLYKGKKIKDSNPQLLGSPLLLK